MRKEQLVKALLKIAKQKASSKKPKATPSKPRTGSLTSKRRISRPKAKVESDSVIAKKIRLEREQKENAKNLAIAAALSRKNVAPEKDRIILIVRDSFWLQAYWEITRATVQRAKVALNGCWHNAKPVLRLLEITSDGNTNSTERVAQEIEIHSGVNNWYLNTNEPDKKYRIAIGYLVPDGKFHLICKSNQVSH